jgi:hypothetical protein
VWIKQSTSTVQLEIHGQIHRHSLHLSLMSVRQLMPHTMDGTLGDMVGSSTQIASFKMLQKS